MRCYLRGRTVHFISFYYLIPTKFTNDSVALVVIFGHNRQSFRAERSQRSSTLDSTIELTLSNYSKQDPVYVVEDYGTSTAGSRAHMISRQQALELPRSALHNQYIMHGVWRLADKVLTVFYVL